MRNVKNLLFVAFVLVMGIFPVTTEATEYRQNDGSGYGLVQTLGRGQTRLVEWQDDGSRIFVASDHVIWVYTDLLEDIAHIELPSDERLIFMDLSPDGSKLALSVLFEDSSYSIQIWDMATSYQLQTSINVFLGDSRAFRWHPNSELLAYPLSDGTIYIWDASTQQNIKTLVGHTNAIEALAWSPDGTRLASTSLDQTSKVWNPELESLVSTLIPNETYTMYDIIWSPLGDKIATTNGSNIEIWETANFQRIDTLPSSAISVRALDWGLYGLASAGNPANEIEIWDVDNSVKTGSLLTTDSVIDLSWHSTSDRLVSVGSDDIIRVWNTTAENVVFMREEHTHSIKSISWNSLGDKIAGGNVNGRIHIWDVNNNNLLEVLQPSASVLLKVVEWRSDDSQLVEASEDTITIWNTATWQVVRSWQDTNAIQIRLLDLKPNGQEIATAGIGTNNINIWDSSTGALLDTLEGHTDDIRGLAWSPTGGLLASSSADGTIRIWDMTTWVLIRTLSANVQRIGAIDWRFDSTQIVVANDSMHSIDIWNVENGRLVASLDGHIGRIDDVAWRPDGAQIVSVGYQSIFVWDVASGQIIAPINEDWGNATVVEWREDGEVFATGDYDGLIRIWGMRE